MGPDSRREKGVARGRGIVAARRVRVKRCDTVVAMTSRAARTSRPPTYTISELAKEFALTTRAIRFYEDCGLITPERAGSARVYGERERVRMKLVLRGKRLGLSLAEIGELLDLYEVARNERAQLSKFLVLLAERRARLLQQKEDIDATLAEIEGLERECRRRLKGTPAAGEKAPAQRTRTNGGAADEDPQAGG
jgi:DNA-binding transcriptional MerR regulator